jgi:colicin import membrane protein
MMWRRESNSGIQQLPDERKALAERYTIDAEEAQRREQLAADEAVRAVAEHERREAALGRKAAEEEARRAAEAEARRVAEAEERARREAAAELERKAAEEEARRAAEAKLERETAAERARRASQDELEPEAAELSVATIGIAETETALEGETPGANSELPIYRWFSGI